MKTYTFKIKVDTDKVVVACHMQLEQFYDSVKMSGMEKLIERYPHTYITASDYYTDDENPSFVVDDYVVSELSTLLNSKNLKSYLTDDGFNSFYGDSGFHLEDSYSYMNAASDFIKLEKEILEKGDDDDVGNDSAEKE